MRTMSSSGWDGLSDRLIVEQTRAVKKIHAILTESSGLALRLPDNPWQLLMHEPPNELASIRDIIAEIVEKHGPEISLCIIGSWMSGVRAYARICESRQATEGML